jgi:tRNA-Thr(GGU) m(6)t(6)A37 methyltransferase TsaA
MPVVNLYSPDPSPGRAALEGLAQEITSVLGIPVDRCWLLWQQVAAESAFRPEWSAGDGPHAPIALITCKDSHSAEAVEKMLLVLRTRLAALLGVPEEQVYAAVDRVGGGDLLVRGSVWKGDDAPAGEGADGPDVVLRPIGTVASERRDLTDDYWGDVPAVIRLDPAHYTAEALRGLDDFSHLEVVFHFHRVPVEKVETSARHPRGNTEWPKVGIFAQRGKNRPNRLGVSRCRLVRVEGLDVHVLGLDAVDGTPVVDIKPYMVEFGPQGEVAQPSWSTEVMREYY